MHVDDGISLINCILLVRRRHIGDVFLTNADLLYDMRRKETGSIGAAHIAFQQTTIGRTNHFDDITRLYSQMAASVTRVRFNANDRCTRMPNRTCRAIRIRAHTGRITYDVACVADAFI